MLFNCTSLFSTYFRCLTCALTGERWLGYVCRRVADRRSVREIEVRGAPRCPFPHAGRIFGRVVAPRMMTRQPPQPLARSQRSYQQADSAAIFARSTIALPGHLRHPAARRPKPAVPPPLSGIRSLGPTYGPGAIRLMPRPSPPRAQGGRMKGLSAAGLYDGLPALVTATAGVDRHERARARRDGRRHARAHPHQNFRC